MIKSKTVTRSFLGLAIMLVWMVQAGQSLHAAEGQQWFRGQLHAHTYWSDGRGFPEQAVEAYKQRGYQFLSVTDHNRFAENPEVWREVTAAEGSWPPHVTQSIFDTYVRTFGKDVQSRIENTTNGPVTYVRLKTYAEVKAKFEEAEKFLLLPGVELTQQGGGLSIHLNYINLPLVLPCIKGSCLIQNITEPKTVSEIIALNVSEAGQAALEQKRPYMLTLNHPFWVYYDIVPQNLIDNPAIRFFEVCNGGSEQEPYPQARTYTVEKFWDAVNAFRRIQTNQLLYGIGTDDAHFYDAKRIDGNFGVGDAWIMVRAESLTPEKLLAALHKGDFYATCGVLLDNVAFTPTDNTLRVKVKVEPGVNYKIHFITTKRGFDRTVTEVTCTPTNHRPERTIPIYSDDIGRIVKTVAGTEAEYRLEADDLYVRARVESDSPSKIAPHFHPKVKTAWTQPYALSESL